MFSEKLLVQNIFVQKTSGYKSLIKKLLAPENDIPKAFVPKDLEQKSWSKFRSNKMLAQKELVFTKVIYPKISLHIISWPLTRIEY